VHAVFDAALFQEALDLGDFLRDGGGGCGHGDEAEVGGAREMLVWDG
jgi:hypothetical protein